MELNKELYIKGVSDYLEGGKNIFDKGSQYVYKSIINSITITEQNTGIKIDYTATDVFLGAFVLYNLGLASKYAGKPITCSADVALNSNTKGKLTIGLISNDGSTRNALQNGEEITSNTEGYSVSATIPSTISSSTPYLGVWVYLNNNATGSVRIEYKNLQVEEGLGVTPYEPHKKYITKQYLEQQENLYNSSTDTTNSYLNSEGEVISLSTWRVTDYIPVVPGSTFYYEGLFNTGVAPMSAFYDSSKQFISSFKQVQGINNITIPSGASYIRFSLNNSDINLFKYDNRSYYGKYVTKQYLEQVEDVSSQNIFNKATPALNAYIDTSTMKIVSAGNQGYSSYVKIKPNTTYTVSKRAGKTFRIGTTTNTPAIGVTINQTLANHTGTTLTITTSSNDNYLVLYCWASSNGDTGTYQEMYATVQVVEGSTAKPYTPYFKLSELANILIPYTLYDNESGTNGNITISENFSNYKEFDVYVANQYGSRRKIERLFYSSDTSKNYTILTYGASANASMSLSATTFNLSGNTLSILNSVTATLKTPPEYNTTNTNYIQKIVGYK